jgi:hypothetical protein
VRIGWDGEVGEVSKGRENGGRESELVEYVTAARPMRKAFPLFVRWRTKISWCLFASLICSNQSFNHLIQAKLFSVIFYRIT